MVPTLSIIFIMISGLLTGGPVGGMLALRAHALRSHQRPQLRRAFGAGALAVVLVCFRMRPASPTEITPRTPDQARPT